MLLTIFRPWWEFERGGLSITGLVDSPRSRRDREETWFAQPLADPDSDPVRWHVEIVEVATDRVIDVIEEATLEEVEVAVNARGALVSTADLDLDEWLAISSDEREDRLRVRGSRRGKRWITDYDFHTLLPFEVTLEGKAKHRGEPVEVHVRLTPSPFDGAARALGHSA